MFLVLGGLFAGLWMRVGDVGEQGLDVAAGLAQAGPRTQVVAGQVAGDLAQPGQETVGVLEATQVLPRRQEGFLGDVFAGGHVAHDRQRDRGHGALAAGDDAAVGFAVAAGGGRQVGVDQAFDDFGAHGGLREGFKPGTSRRGRV